MLQIVLDENSLSSPTPADQKKDDDVFQKVVNSLTVLKNGGKSLEFIFKTKMRIADFAIIILGFFIHYDSFSQLINILSFF